ncbi:MAG: alpha/beta hydrolase family protein [Myxococcota bacterium]
MIGPLGLGERLLALGMVVVEYETDWSVLRGLRDEEERPPPEPNVVGSWMLAAPRAEIVGRGYFGVIGGTASGSVPRVVDLVASLPEVDASRIAIAGSSTYGFVALEAMRVEPRLAAGVVRVACGDYHAFLRSSSLALADDPKWLPGGELVLDPAYDATLTAREPYRHADAYPPRPLLLLNGANDPAIPIACAERTAAAMQQAYLAAGVAERFRFQLYPDAGHDLGPDAQEVVLGWWKRWLLAPDR